ncbi:MAG: metal-dependent hydrolase [Acidobacteriota bacterium]|nr:metal-dependent hydrolase [Acidobacteriota bacterium]
MDNLTHSLVGLVASKAGLERLSPGTTTLCVLAANAPDADILALVFGGRWAFLHHHRGITHSLLGTLALALALPCIFYLGDILRVRIRGRRSPGLKLRGLIVASLVVTATHPVMDWANNYGVRFLLPWNSKWFYGDFVFIVDPFIWLVLGGAAFLLTSKTRKHIIVWVIIALVPSYLVLVGAPGPNRLLHEVVLRLLWIVVLIILVTLYRRRIGGRLGAKIAIAGLATVTIYCAGLAVTHVVALRQAKIEALSIANRNAEQLFKVAAMPMIANPAEWFCLMETNRATYRFNLSLIHNRAGVRDLVGFERLEASDQAIDEASRDPRARIFLGFARFPAIRVVGEDCATQTLVQFADLRYTEPGRGRGTFSLDVPVDCPAEKSTNTNERRKSN